MSASLNFSGCFMLLPFPQSRSEMAANKSPNFDVAPIFIAMP